MLKLNKASHGPSPQQAMLGAENFWHGCKRCGRCMSRRSMLFGAGNPAAAFMIIGSTPTSKEDKTGKFFAGDVGRFVTERLLSSGLTPNDVYVTLALKCIGEGVVDENEEFRRKDPTDDEIKACEAALQWQLKIVRPAVVLLHGKWAHKVITGDPRPLTKVLGHSRLLPNKQTIAISTHNPNGLLFGDRVKLQDQYIEHWNGAVERLNVMGRIWRPDAPTFVRGWKLEQ